jgi:hypothetical protein
MKLRKTNLTQIKAKRLGPFQKRNWKRLEGSDPELLAFLKPIELLNLRFYFMNKHVLFYLIHNMQNKRNQILKN